MGILGIFSVSLILGLAVFSGMALSGILGGENGALSGILGLAVFSGMALSGILGGENGALSGILAPPFARMFLSPGTLAARSSRQRELLGLANARNRETERFSPRECFCLAALSHHLAPARPAAVLFNPGELVSV